jgi:hypothetical protein
MGWRRSLIQTDRGRTAILFVRNINRCIWIFTIGMNYCYWAQITLRWHFNRKTALVMSNLALIRSALKLHAQFLSFPSKLSLERADVSS